MRGLVPFILSLIVMFFVFEPDGEGYAATVAAGDPTRLHVVTTGGTETVFDWKRDACSRNTNPDAPARAFRDDQGQVHLFAADATNWSLVGPTLESGKMRCSPAFEAGRSRDPALADSNGWIEGLYTENGQDVLGLVSNDWSSDEPNTRNSQHLWSINEIYSVDRGLSFVYAKPSHIVAAIGVADIAKSHRSEGFATTSNIFREGRATYVFIGLRSNSREHSGSCLFRSEDPFKAADWSVWNGHDYVQYARSSRAIEGDTISRACEPVSIPFPDPVELRSVNRFQDCDCYVAVFDGARQLRNKPTEMGFFLTSSHDLIHWTTPELILGRPAYEACKDILVYPSLLDPKSTSPNFSDVTANPYLYFSRFNRNGCTGKGIVDRDLVRVRLHLTVLPSDGR